MWFRSPNRELTILIVSFRCWSHLNLHTNSACLGDSYNLLVLLGDTCLCYSGVVLRNYAYWEHSFAPSLLWFHFLIGHFLIQSWEGFLVIIIPCSFRYLNELFLGQIWNIQYGEWGSDHQMFLWPYNSCAPIYIRHIQRRLFWLVCCSYLFYSTVCIFHY